MIGDPARGMFERMAPLERSTRRARRRSTASIASATTCASSRASRDGCRADVHRNRAGRRPHRCRSTRGRRPALARRRGRARHRPTSRSATAIAVDGCCLTVVASDGARLAFDVSARDARRHGGPRCGRGGVNLEKSLRLSDRLGGHLVPGTSTAWARSRVHPVADAGGSWRLEIDAPRRSRASSRRRARSPWTA